MTKVGPSNNSRGNSPGSSSLLKSKRVVGGVQEVGSTSRSSFKKPKRNFVAEFQHSLVRSISKPNGGIKKQAHS